MKAMSIQRSMHIKKISKERLLERKLIKCFLKWKRKSLKPPNSLGLKDVASGSD